MNLTKTIEKHLNTAFGLAHSAECHARAGRSSDALSCSFCAKIEIETARALLRGEHPQTGAKLNTTFMEVTEVNSAEELEAALSEVGE